MKKTHILIAVILAYLSVSSAAAQTNAQDGVIVENEPCAAVPKRTYEQYVEQSKKQAIETAALQKLKLDLSNFAATVLSREEFERRQSFSDYDCRRVKYLSDGLKVVGYIWKPKNTTGKKLPLVIVNRGSNRESGKLTPTSFFYPFVINGFVVIGSQYRGNDGGEGREEYGGADVNDVMNLIPLAKSLGYADMNNVFMVGFSRGSWMSFIAMKRNIPVNAVAVYGSVPDLAASIAQRPGVGETVKALVPDFETRRAEALRERSAINWADKLNVPILMIHGSADQQADVSSVLTFAQKLQSLGKTYELIVYANDDHFTSINRLDREKRTVEWFKKYIK